MAIAFDAASSSSGSEVYGPTTTFAHTVTASGSGKIHIVGTSCKYTVGRYVSGITYGGEALTKLHRRAWFGGSQYLELWYLVNPPTGANNNIVTYTGNVHDVCVSASYTGVDVDDPFGTLTSAGGTGTALAAPSVTSESGQLVIDIATVEQGSAPTVNAGAGQTERKKKYETNSALWAGISEEAGAASVDMTWAQSGSRGWAILAVPLKPEVAGIERSIKYWASTLDPKRRIFDNTGRVIPASLVEYDNWLRNEGPYFMTPNKHTSLIEADSIGYLEAIKFNESGRTQFITETETLLESLFRRLGARGA
jgi:hypothetical protein